jgi:hypothetical protein
MSGAAAEEVEDVGVMELEALEGLRIEPGPSSGEPIKDVE